MPGKEKFTPVQKSNAVLWYGICGDPKIVQLKFKNVYGRTDHSIEAPHADQIKQWYKNFRHTGFIEEQDAVVHEEITGETLPHMQHESKVGHVFSSVLSKLNNVFLDGPRVRTFHPYHMELIKHGVEDLEERTDFAKVQLLHIKKWSHILHSMWFTGEAKFYVDGRVESNNLIYTTNKRPDEYENLPHKHVKQYAPSNEPHITVWSAMNSELLIGPYFFSEDISSDTYKEILKKFVNELHHITSHYEHPIFIQDDSKVHSNAEIAKFLEKEFPNHWIGSGSNFAKWPHHSPDLSPINFFLWGYIKSRVYKNPIEAGDVDELKKRIENAFKNVTQDLLEEGIEEYKTRLERVVKTNGHLVDSTVYGEEIDYDSLKVWGTYAWPYM